jgi:hypothetical protein
VVGIKPKSSERSGRARRIAVRLGGRIALLGVLAALIVPATALAASPTQAQYGSQVKATFTGGGKGGSPSVPSTNATTSQGGSLPFTGLDVGVLALIGGGLVVTGFALRRRRHITGEQA